jgi:hypothetical protein
VGAISRKYFDSSGKSPAMFHHRAIREMPMVFPAPGISARAQADILDHN